MGRLRLSGRYVKVRIAKRQSFHDSTRSLHTSIRVWHPLCFFRIKVVRSDRIRNKHWLNTWRHLYGRSSIQGCRCSSGWTWCAFPPSPRLFSRLP